MAIGDLIHSVTSIVARATRRLRPHTSFTQIAGPARAHLLARGASFIPFKKRSKGKKKSEDGVWRRTIILGEKCHPLDFSGAIHYDSDGNQVSDPPVKSQLRSPLPDFLLNLDPSARCCPPGNGEGEVIKTRFR